MKQTVWKFPLALSSNRQHVPMPADATVVHVAMQHGVPCLWALHVPGGPQCVRVFTVHGTGHEVEQGARHVGTCMEDPFVWHVFEVAEA